MDATRFDTFVRVLTTRHRRRGTLPLLALLGLGLVDSDAAEAAKSGKCKRQPGPCETCQKGKCERKHGKKTCKAGKLKPKANGTACTGGSCQSGLCVAPSGPVVPQPPGGTSPPPPPPLTCLEACADNCRYCFNLAEGGTLCSDAPTCNSFACSSSAACASHDPSYPFCATSYVDLDVVQTSQGCGFSVGSGVCYLQLACT